MGFWGLWGDSQGSEQKGGVRATQLSMSEGRGLYFVTSVP